MIKLEVDSYTVDYQTIFYCKNFCPQIHKKYVCTNIEKFDLIPETLFDIINFLHFVYFGLTIIIFDFDVVQAKYIFFLRVFA